MTSSNLLHKQVLAGAFLSIAAGVTIAQVQVYKCGNTYSQTPCGHNAEKIVVTPAYQSSGQPDHQGSYTPTGRAEKLRQQVRTSQNNRRLHDLQNHLIPNLRRKIAADTAACEKSISDRDRSKIYWLKNVAKQNKKEMEEMLNQCQKKADAMTAKLRRLEEEAQSLSLSK
ncbi:hypothetical protein CK623_03820 [Vandammella animalimorsus]|uniref:DUF4124 domain-containing protein n=1 Tax=Vandammella animalimorsus TaxID=2029117 RepID=A0A2A2AT58_9BURK|nr:hypothetical protein [Vandammella animalimorsus]PAT40911.1 hypothetical protein CK623_03820 [Vandammella animalimorsus]